MRQHGIHHVTAIAGPASRNLDFYTQVLGLRLVKKTVNFDDPSTYHLYYGDAAGQPGTILTFFPWEHAAPGRLGVGETQETVFRVPQASIGFWTHRFVEKGVLHEAPEKRFGETVLSFKDPDGTRLAVVGIAGIDDAPFWNGSDIPAEAAIRGFHSVSLLVAEAAPTGAILTDVLGFKEVAREGSLVRFASGDTALGGIVDLREAGGFLKGRPGAGTVHHVAFRAASDAVQTEMVEKLARNHGIVATEPKNRDYFRAVYFREPGGLLFEIATDDPGFAVDEAADALGQALKLPAFLEKRRAEIEAVLPAIA
ncbi:ring-cleaving dioxygenase [Microvirga antarctica]|uniref:ring-cleaving dioxygenase n=1 Tax=Microvirga antarctica TaxID=2819233 RepID=UPI001B30E9A3|nr:ring-cleaving dioxygenase [Microvirga antarctica]